MILKKIREEDINYFFYLLKKNPLTICGAIIILLIILCAIFASFIAPYPEDRGAPLKLSERLQPPSKDHLFGTDEMGRDIFSRIIFGCRISLKIGILVVLISMTIGSVLGVLAGYFGGIVDIIIMRLTDIFLSIPALMLALAIGAVLGPSLENAMLAIVVVWWPWYARLVRGTVLSVREEPYVESARAVGASNFRIIMRYILPNSISPAIIQASLDFGYTILTAASLGFLGVGAQPPTPEWGLMVSIGRKVFPTFWWCATFPGFAIFITVIGFNLLGDGIREMIDPRLRVR